MDKPLVYRIRVKGHLDSTWSDWFEGLTVSNLEGGEAILVGPLPDQAALQGVLNQISNLGMTLISLHSVNAED